MLLEYIKPEDLNEARLRMARIPHGAELVENPVSKAPGFWIGNVIVMAGVPTIMQAMLDQVAPKLKTGVRMLSETVRADAREGDVGGPLGAIAKANPEVSIGSYPFMGEDGRPNTNLVLRSRDQAKLAAAVAQPAPVAPQAQPAPAARLDEDTSLNVADILGEEDGGAADANAFGNNP
jgi:molybdopterin-biosynthesis enzyme MoeA-like protein